MLVRAAKTFLFVIIKFLEVKVAYIPIEKKWLPSKNNKCNSCSSTYLRFY